MNKITNTILMAAMLFSQILFQSCQEDEPIRETERIKGILKASLWKMQSVIVDGTDQSTIYTGLTLSFTDNSFSATNGGGVWPASGTWSFTDDTGKLITRGDGLGVNVEEATESRLSLKLSWSKTSLGGGRTSSVAGNHVFSFVK